MKLTERIQWNAADAYVLKCASFPLERIACFDKVYLQIEESLCIHVYSLAEPILLEHEKYSDLICPRAILVELEEQIESEFDDVSHLGKYTFWTILAQYLWKYADRVLCDIKHERRFKDPLLGDFFKALEDAKKRGLFGH